MQKQISNITALALKPNSMGFKSVDMFQNDFGFEPFLVFTEFHMDRAIFGPHPHAGVSVMTYMMPDSAGSFLNRDSHGDHSIIEPGGVHVTQTGRGIQHDEVPTQTGIDCHGFQIWINHADSNRLVEPKAFHAFSKDIPEYKDDNIKLRVIQGSFSNLVSPIDLLTKTSLFDITLQPNTTIELDAKEMAFVYLMAGEIAIGDQQIIGRSMVSFDKKGNKIKVSTGSEPTSFMFASGTPHNESIVYGGPFVMTTQEQMIATKQRYQRGEMGELKSVL
jgi:quercetin 2,3-dioxygenase